MIIGMLAVADKSILDDHVETMLKVGLGKIGSVSSYLIPVFLRISSHKPSISILD